MNHGELEVEVLLASLYRRSLSERQGHVRRENASAAGVKLHHGGMPNAPTGRLLLRDKQDEKRIASPANVPETSSVTSPSVLPLPQLILRPAPAPLLNPRSMLTDVGPCGVVGDALASSKRSGKSTGLLLAGYAAAYALRHTRHAYLPYPLAPARKIGRDRSDEAVGVSFGQHSSYPGCPLPGL
jgi:hypothetical protein